MANFQTDQKSLRLRSEEQPGFLTKLAWQRVMSIFSEVFHGHGFTPMQHMALTAVDDLGETTQRHLSRYQNIEASNLHGTLKKLAARELISIETNPSIKRNSVIKLTAKGKRLLKELEPLDRKVSEQYLSGLSIKEQRQLKKLLYKVVFGDK